jgi:hypothetical protein
VAKQGALGAQLWVSGYDLGDDIREFATRAPVQTFDFTPITKSAMVRGFGKRDGGITCTAFFNPTATRSHPRFSLLPTADQLISVAIPTATSLAIGDPSVSQWAKQLNYDGVRAADGMLTFAVDHMANGYPLEWGQLLTAGTRTDTGATNGSPLDLGSASPGAFGAQFHLHVISFAGTDVTIKIQESSDNAGDAYADVVGGGFTAVTAGPGFQRISTAAIAVERYLRVVTTTSGGFTSCAFVVQGVRNDVTPVAV